MKYWGRQKPPDWGKMTSIPLSFQDGKLKFEEIEDKPLDYPPSAHTHSWASIADKPLSFTPAAHNHDWMSISSKPTAFPPLAHTHPYLPDTGGDPDNFHLWNTKYYRWDGINNNYKNIYPISGLSSSFGALLEAPAYGNFGIGIRPNQANDGFVLLFTDVASDPSLVNYTLCKVRIVRGEIYLDASRLILANLPTASAGLPTGTLWRDTNILKIA